MTLVLVARPVSDWHDWHQYGQYERAVEGRQQDDVDVDAPDSAVAGDTRGTPEQDDEPPPRYTFTFASYFQYLPLPFVFAGPMN